MIITIDGPAGAGKSTGAKALARRLGFQFLDTGAMYRAVTLATLRAGVNPCDQESLSHLLDSLRLEMPPGGAVILNGEDVSTAIRSLEVTAASGAIADSHAVRQRLVLMQRELAQGRDIVCEGRDQGSVVFPEAACKFFLVADPVERARRRQHDLAARGDNVSLDEVLQAQEARDRRDATRDMGAMVPAPDAIVIDSTGLTHEQMVDLMEQHARRCGAG